VIKSIKNIFKNKIQRGLNSEEKLQLAQNKVGQAFSMFHDAYNSISEANKILGEAKQQDQENKEILLRRISNIDKNLEKTDDNIGVNLAVQEELLKFLPKNRQ
jgi:hypothetical protein